MVYTTVYVSTLHDELPTTEINELLVKSRERNALDGISGLLVLRGRRVMQLLEGEEAAVRDLYSRIIADPRHGGVVTVWSSATEGRRFPDWTMGFDDLEATSELPSPEPVWPTPEYESVTSLPVSDSGDVAEYVERRAKALRRALVSGQQLVTTLAIILHGHRPEAVLNDEGALSYRCAECRIFTARGTEQYPCATAKNAIWALESR